MRDVRVKRPKMIIAGRQAECVLLVCEVYREQYVDWACVPLITGRLF